MRSRSSGGPPYCELQMHGWAGSVATGRAAEAAAHPSGGIAQGRCAGSRGGGWRGQHWGDAEATNGKAEVVEGGMLVAVAVAAEGMAWGGASDLRCSGWGGRAVAVPSHHAIGI